MDAEFYPQAIYPVVPLEPVALSGVDRVQSHDRESGLGGILTANLLVRLVYLDREICDAVEHDVHSTILAGISVACVFCKYSRRKKESERNYLLPPPLY